MKIVVRNNNPIPTTEKYYYKCNVCDSERFWSDTHGYIERPVEDWVEERFYICHDECRIKAREPFIKWLSSKDGWNIKKATENYDKYILPFINVIP